MLDGSLAAFVQRDVGIHIGTRNERFEPNGARALAATVNADGTELVVYLAEVAAARLLPDLYGNRQVAVSFGRPVDERACQIKGEVVSVRAAEPQEREQIRATFDSFLDNLELIGIPRVGATNWSAWPAVAIRLKVTAVFEQTPGPDAGKRVP